MIHTPTLDRAVRLVMPDVIFAMRNGSCRTYSFAIQAHHPIIIRVYHEMMKEQQND